MINNVRGRSSDQLNALVLTDAERELVSTDLADVSEVGASDH